MEWEKKIEESLSQVYSTPLEAHPKSFQKEKKIVNFKGIRTKTAFFSPSPSTFQMKQ